ncbi:hypothetical protein M406DRAFT_72594 [Cryphonectria parasitica EP155]|uniref:Uncharacterized protein n=1 Tax=Cryphonectria parasitica (strain ATCC 38755 / EP155) TaxID=660469 RepID=A0A9P4XWI4_CRYP1|nr:uncharacterized protein M406DRAFT_72594 [Cryphonectria parasitica EP155]KAF3762607.1 hypothetical protein M406DRAFT_72594 [Cryphonectria parasitica EP155]
MDPEQAEGVTTRSAAAKAKARAEATIGPAIKDEDVDWTEIQLDKTQMLTATNYRTWKVTVASMMDLAGIPQAEDAVLTPKADQRLGVRLRKTISTDILKRFANITSGMELWQALLDTYGTTGPASQMFWFCELMNLKLKNDPIEYCSKFRSLVADIHGANVLFAGTLACLMFVQGVSQARPEWAARARTTLRTTPSTPLSDLISDLTDEFVV